MKGKNCPNCGAVYTLEDIKCPYCGTLYFDMTAIDFTENKPIFIRYKIPYDKEKNILGHGKDVAYLVPHQANVRIIEAVGRRMGVSEDQVMINIQKYGNTSAGTIPVCLSEWESKLKKGDNLILTIISKRLSILIAFFYLYALLKKN